PNTIRWSCATRSASCRCRVPATSRAWKACASCRPKAWRSSAAGPRSGFPGHADAQPRVEIRVLVHPVAAVAARIADDAGAIDRVVEAVVRVAVDPEVGPAQQAGALGHEPRADQRFGKA